MAPEAAEAARWAWLKGRRLPPPGLHAHYSNLGFDLLGDALAAADKRPYVEALKARVTAPLAMADTTSRLTADECARLMAPGALTAETPCQDTTEAAASGGIYSTAADMAAWIKHQLPSGAPGADVRAGQAIYVRPETLASQEGLDVAGPPAGIGLAWIQLAPTATHATLLEKTGGGGGFMTYVVIDPLARVGVFVAIDRMGHRQIQALSARANDLVGALAAAKAR
jgi:D-alanyl-D-alanine-carboxypeptidase/D-alanyl-D-alanine-endopeptidase